MPWLEIIGWVGSALVVLSLMQARVLRFRWLNFVGAVIATGYNAVIEVWPFAAMNGAIALIDAYWLWRLYREAHDGEVYQVVAVAPCEAYLAHVLRVNAADIAATHPDFDPDATGDARRAWLVERGDETVGVVVVSLAGGTAVVNLDWVSPRFRDFTPGEFVHRDSGIFTALGVDRLVVPASEAADRTYLKRMGYAPDGDGAWVRQVATV